MSGLVIDSGLSPAVNVKLDAVGDVAENIARKEQQEAVQASDARLPIRYISPVVRLDAETKQVVVLYRDTSTGQVNSQYPTEKHLQAYKKGQNLSSDTDVPTGDVLSLIAGDV